MDNITIRLEQTSDYRETEEVVREAFWNVYSPGCTEHYGIRTSGNRYAAALQACPLYRNALQGLAGRYFEDDIYLVDEAKAALFDKQFPPKEMLSGTPSQQRFKEISAMVKEYPGKYF